jgi:omega-amidase|tara:strand:+ start:34226 stop:35014 length:789 start_codon:yes stop_codon:yes gene_type:complete
MMPLRTTLIQSELHWENVAANLAHFEELIWELPSTDLIILPEMFSTGFSMNPELLSEAVHTRTFRWMRQISEQKNTVLMGSYIVRDQGNFFNRLYAVYPDGSSHFYDKKHLFGLAGEQEHYTSGSQKLIIEIKGWRICPMICYDLRFPIWSRSRASFDQLYEYDLLVYVASWPKPRINAWDTLLAARAIENQSYAIGVNRLGTDGNALEYCGHSAVYDFLGKNQLDLGETAGIHTAILDKQSLMLFREEYPFQKDSDSFELP